MSTSRRLYTAAQLDDMPDDGQRYEIIDGELFVTPAPIGRHQDAIVELVLLLTPYARAHGLNLRVAPTEVRFSGSSVVQPDLIVLPAMPDGTRAPEFTDVGRLVVVVVVLSPGTARQDRGKKRALYQRELVDEYWIVDVDARVVERWRPTTVVAEVFTGAMEWQPVPGAKALPVDWSAFFRIVATE